MRTRFHLLCVLVGLAILFVSCAQTELIPVEDSYYSYDYVKKTKGDEVLWGVRTDNRIIVPVEYDKIERQKELSVFIAYKGARRYIYCASFYPFDTVCQDDELEGAVYNGFRIVHGRRELGFEKVFYNEMFKNSMYFAYNLYQIFSDGGKSYFMYWDGKGKVDYNNRYAPMIFGPYEDFYATRTGYIFKDDGKWGFYTFEQHSNPLRFSKKLLFPAQYDALFEVVYARGYGKYESYFLYKNLGSWTLTDIQGIPGYIPGHSIPEILRMPISEASYHIDRYGSYSYHKTFRLGTADCGVIYLE